VHAIGEAVQQRWLDTAQAAGLEISVGGLPALANYSVVGLDPLLVKTYVTSRLLDEGFLGGLSVYASIAHTDTVLDQYFTAVSKVMIELAQLDDAGLRQLLPDGTAHGGFARLT
jgi:glutamate-1-semialdehyde 2,1-aminomutase